MVFTDNINTQIKGNQKRWKNNNSDNPENRTSWTGKIQQCYNKIIKQEIEQLITVGPRPTLQRFANNEVIMGMLQ